MAKPQRHLPTELKDQFEKYLTEAGIEFKCGPDYPASFEFQIDGKAARAGLHLASASWVVTMQLGQLTTDPGQLEALLAAIQTANGKLPKALKHARFIESDCYLLAEAKREFLWVAKKAETQRERLEQVLADARAVAAHEASARIMDDFGL